MTHLNEKAIKEVLRGYIADLPQYNLTRWDCVNYLIGYYGSINADHIKAIGAMVRAGKILP